MSDSLLAIGRVCGGGFEIQSDVGRYIMENRTRARINTQRKYILTTLANLYFIKHRAVWPIAPSALFQSRLQLCFSGFSLGKLLVFCSDDSAISRAAFVPLKYFIPSCKFLQLINFANKTTGLSCYWPPILLFVTIRVYMLT